MSTYIFDVDVDGRGFGGRVLIPTVEMVEFRPVGDL
jgi:hypothetical protein